MTASRIQNKTGWVMVAGLLLVMTVCHGIITSALPALDKTLLGDLNISRGDLKLRESIFLLSAGISGLGIGFLTSRLSPRTIVLMGLGLLCVVLGSYGQAKTIHQIYALYALLGLCYASSHVVIIVLMVRQYFEEKRTLAISVALSGTSIGSAIFPSVTTLALQYYEWRQVLMGMAILPIILLVPVALMLPRGEKGKVEMFATTAVSTAKKHSPFLIGLLLLSIFATFFSSTAFLLNLFLYLQDIGLSARATAAGVSLVFMVGLVGKVLVGMAAEKWGTYAVWGGAQAILLVGALVLSVGHPILAFVGLGLLGLGWAGCYVMTQVVISDTFAGPNLGKIAGGFIVFESIASGSGVWSAAALSDYFGSYRGAFLLCCGLLAIAIVSTSLFRKMSRAA